MRRIDYLQDLWLQFEVIYVFHQKKFEAYPTIKHIIALGKASGYLT